MAAFAFGVSGRARHSSVDVVFSTKDDHFLRACLSASASQLEGGSELQLAHELRVPATEPPTPTEGNFSQPLRHKQTKARRLPVARYQVSLVCVCVRATPIDGSSAAADQLISFETEWRARCSAARQLALGAGERRAECTEREGARTKTGEMRSTIHHAAASRDKPIERRASNETRSWQHCERGRRRRTRLDGSARPLSCGP